jgi:hypothetical protein
VNAIRGADLTTSASQPVAGHVFITQSDLTRLRCDAWLLPTDSSLTVEPFWLRLAPSGIRRPTQGGQLRLEATASWKKGETRVRKLSEWPAGGPEPQTWLVNVGGAPGTPVEWYLEGVRQFVAAAARDLAALEGPGSQRALPLVAMPLVGTGQGGAAAIKGEVVGQLLDELYRAASIHAVDLLLVTHDAPAFAAAQAVRRARSGPVGTDQYRSFWSQLDPQLLEHAARLAHHAATGSLVLFLGAGVSVGAGLPTWPALLRLLGERAGLSDQLDALAELPLVDQARIVESRMQSRRELAHLIATELTTNRFSLSHSLLAALPVSEIITTNYDRLFEMAAEALGPDRAVALLPDEVPNHRRRWLLKLHGSIDRPESIVLTREDYLRYGDRRAALAAIVQALLLTRHMLFVGFSLTDDNFHRIADDVRKVVRGPGPAAPGQPFGTALLPTGGLTDQLWRDDLHCLSMDTAPSSDAATAILVRRVEIFLDCILAAATSNAAHLLDEAYTGILTKEEREIRRALKALARTVSPDAQRAPAWAPVAHLLRAMGSPEIHPSPPQGPLTPP